MKILLVTSEMAPLAKSGGLADVLGALPQALNELGHDARVVLPLYRQIKLQYQDQLEFLCWTTTKMNWRQSHNGLFRLKVNGVIVYLIDNEYYFNHDAIYVDYDFDMERYAFFQRAVLDMLGDRMDFWPDIIHCNDWQSGMIPMLLDTQFKSRGFFRQLDCVYTIHNLKYQGKYGYDPIRDFFDLPDDLMREDTCLQAGTPNFMKAGIVYANRVTTVSPSYAQEMMTDYYGEGLNGVLQQYQWKVRGILNGLDTESYNPRRDQALYRKYSQQSWRKGKAYNKERLQKDLGLPPRRNWPLLVMVSRLTRQKGLDLLLRIADELLAEDVQLVVMGTGDSYYETELRDLQGRHPDKMRAVIAFDEARSRCLYAAGDIFLMPSLFEPCGLSQMIAMRYGCLPLVRETGGLKDTVEPYNRYEDTGNGFSFSNINAHEFLFVAKDVLALYHEDQKAWGHMVRKGLQEDFSWQQSAQEYVHLYEEIRRETGHGG